jgi:hypothetical protein
LLIAVKKAAVLGPAYVLNLAKIYTVVGTDDKEIEQPEYLVCPSAINKILFFLFSSSYHGTEVVIFD